MNKIDLEVENIRQRIKRERERQNLSQLFLATKADIAQSHYSEIESGKSIPSIKMLLKIADALEVDISFFFDKKSPNREEVKQKIIDLIATAL